MSPAFATYEPDVRGVPDGRAVIRPAQTSDACGIALVDATRGPLRPGHLARVLAQIDGPATHRIVAVVDGTVVGSCMTARWAGHADAPDGYYVAGVTVQPALRRRGIGDLLVAGLLDWIWRRSDGAWSVINAQNGPSLALHRRRGFATVATGSTFAGISFTGGCGVLLRADHP